MWMVGEKDSHLQNALLNNLYDVMFHLMISNMRKLYMARGM